MSLTTLNNCKTILNISSLVTEYDDIINSLITVASSLVTAYLGSNIQATQEDYEFEGIEGLYKILPFINVTGVNSLSYRAEPTENYTEYANQDYALTRKSNVDYLFLREGFTNYQYKVNLSYGYSTVPAAVTEAVNQLVYLNFKKGDYLGEGNLGKDSIVKNYGGVDMNIKLKDEVNNILESVSHWRLYPC